MERKLFRPLENRLLFGVCSGIAKYFNADPTVVRLIFAFLVVFGGTGLLAYFIAALIMPSEIESF